MQNQINTTPITQFIQLVKAAEISQSKEVKLTIQQARLLNLAFSEILIKMNQDYESMYNALKASVNPEVVTVQLDGGGFGTPG
jgi:hypothetical protein